MPRRLGGPRLRILPNGDAALLLRLLFLCKSLLSIAAARNRRWPRRVLLETRAGVVLPGPMLFLAPFYQPQESGMRTPIWQRNKQ